MSEKALQRIAENKKTRATMLNLNGCFLRDLPPDLSECVWLKELHLHKNEELSDLSPLIDLQNLQKLYVSYTQIVDLSPLKNLQNLQQLEAFYTQIADLSPLKNLHNLQLLNVSYTQVVDLSPLLFLIKKGKQVKRITNGGDIDVEGCPLTSPPPDVVRQSNEAILRYIEQLEKEGTNQIFESKLLLIGEGGAGKTTLFRKLFDPVAELPKEKDSTQSIDIRPLYFDMPDGNEFRLNIWDFPGQGKYQSVHSFFYTHRSLYVLVDDTRTLDENEAYRTFYHFWLQTAELFGGDSPLLVLHNQKADRARTGFNLGSFQAIFPFVKELFCINLGSNDIAGIRDLKTQIERWAQKLPHIGDAVPRTWVRVREDIEKERQQRPYISDERYREICASHGIINEVEQSDLSRYFHDLGVFLHFQENPLLRRDVFLQNEWVTNAVYKILDDPEIAVKKRGRFDKNDLARLWKEGYYAKRRDELLALMLLFELCYQVQDTEIYVALQLLPGDVPKYDLGKDIPLQLKYEYAFMPKGLLHRLIVRLHPYIAQGQSAVWSGGVVLEHTSAQADIIESLDRRQISVRAVGVHAKELVTIINYEVEKLHRTYGKRLTVEAKIPCKCRICKTNNMPHFYDKKDLDNRLMKGKATVECRVSFDNVNVQVLLDGVFTKVVESKTMTGSPRLITPHTIKIFLASSSELRDDRDAFDLYFRQQNDHLMEEKGIYLKIVRWENFLDAMSETRLQDEYNKEVQACDIFISLFFTKTGKYTEEEFDVAQQQFKSTRKPQIFTFFKKPDMVASKDKQKDLQSLWAFQEKLDNLGHFHTNYDNIEHLKLQFRDQLDKLLRQVKI